MAGNAAVVRRTEKMIVSAHSAALKNRRIGNVPNAMPNVRAISAPNAENPSLRQKRNVPNAAI